MIQDSVYPFTDRIGKRCTMSVWIAIGVTISFAAIADETMFAAPLDSFAALNERPLFSVNRRAVEAPVEAPAAIDTPTPLPLEGTLMGLAKSDEGGFTILRLSDEAQPVQLHIGDVIRGWQLMSIENHTAQFSKDGQTISLSFP